MNNFLHFKASTNVKNLIGKDLVTDEITAVFELVKNSYDADATNVRVEFTGLTSGNSALTITDNGIGMDLIDIQEKWMVIGTESKKYKQFSDKFDRPLNGDKGIGRFSVDRLGKKLELLTVKENGTNEIYMNVDWLEFENEFKSLEEVSIPYKVYKTENHQGLTLKIKELRDIWDRKNIDKLVRNLRQFKSPFKINDNFKIIINIPEYNMHDIEIMPYNLGEISSIWVAAEIPVEDTSKINIEVIKDGIKYNEQYINPFNFGPIKSTIYFFNQADKLRFNNRLGITVKDFGNIRLYRDSFRIYPYGDSLNDWLDLDMRKSQGFSRFFGSRDLVGYAQIYKKYNSKLDAPTNRQGLIENNYTAELRKFIIDYAVKTLEKYFFQFKKASNETFHKTKQEVESAIVELNKVAKEIQLTNPQVAKIIKQASQVVQKGQATQTDFVKNQEELIKVYKRVASKEVFLHRIVHEALINLDAAKTVSRSLLNITQENEALSICSYKGKIHSMDMAINASWSILLKARDNLIQKKQKENVNMKYQINNILNTFEHRLKEAHIKSRIFIDDDIVYSIDKKDLQTIVENLISNSIKSLLKVDSRERIIDIKCVKKERYIIFNFKDNGVGISEHLRERIFDHFFSTTNSFGMGLSIVDEIIKEYNGEFNLVDNNESGADFQVKLRR